MDRIGVAVLGESGLLRRAGLAGAAHLVDGLFAGEEIGLADHAAAQAGRNRVDRYLDFEARGQVGAGADGEGDRGLILGELNSGGSAGRGGDFVKGARDAGGARIAAEELPDRVRAVRNGA